MKTLAAHQPQYLPWLGFFDKLAQADIFVLLDNVQFKKNEWQNRNRIKTATGWQWITVPVRHKFPQTIADVEVDNSAPWRRKHQTAIDTNYAGAPYFEEVRPVIAEVFETSWSRLAPLNVTLIQRLAALLGIDTETVLGSAVPARDEPTLRLVDLCEQLGADTYISGAGARDYLQLDAFDKAGIDVRFQTFEHPTYPQLFEGFVPFLSVADLIMNCGRESLRIIESGRLRGR